MKTAKNSKNIIAKCAAALMTGLLVISGMGMKVYAASAIIVIDGSTEATTDYSNTPFIGIDGKKLTIMEDEINSIKTAGGGVASATIGVQQNQTGTTMSIGSLSGGIKLAANDSGQPAGIRVSNGTLTINKLGDVSVSNSNTAGWAFGIRVTTGSLTITSNTDTINIEATADKAYKTYAVANDGDGIINLGETGKTVNLVGTVKNDTNATLNLAGTTNVTGYVDNYGTLNLNGQMTVSDNFGTVDGFIKVDMSFVGTDSKPDRVVLIDCNGTTADYGTYQFAEGKDNGYKLVVEGNDLVAKIEDQTLTFDSETLTKTYRDAAFTQEVKGAHTTVTYSSSETSVATVNSSTGLVTIVKPGTTTIKASAAAGSGYKSAEKSYTLTVNAKELTVAGTAVNGKTYDGTTDAVVGRLGTLTGAVAGDDVSIDTSVATFDNKNAGNGHNVTVKYTLKGAAAGNYTVKDSTDVVADIVKKEVKVTADARSSYVGSDIVALTYTADALATGDSFTGALATAADKNTVGDYDITQGTLAVNDGNDGNNYTITFTKGTYTVKENSVAKTGDSTNMWLYIALAALALGAMGTVVVMRRKADR